MFGFRQTCHIRYPYQILAYAPSQFQTYKYTLLFYFSSFISSFFSILNFSTITKETTNIQIETMASGGTEAFPDLGKHCQHVDCHQLDFLPFTCDGCKQVFSFIYYFDISTKFPISSIFE